MANWGFSLIKAFLPLIAISYKHPFSLVQDLPRRFHEGQRQTQFVFTGG